MRNARPGFSLLEVLTALTIFLFSLLGIGQLLSHASERVRDAQQVGQAALLCQAKLADVLSGAVSLTSQGDVTCDEDPDYQWSLECAASSTPGLWNVKVQVSRNPPEGKRVLCTLSQMVLDPAKRGGTASGTAAAAASSQGGN